MIALFSDADATVVVALIGLMGLLAGFLWNGMQNHRIERRLKDGNGDEKPIGQMVYDLDKKVEVVIAKQHEQGKTMGAMREEYLERIERLETKAQAQARRKRK